MSARRKTADGDGSTRRGSHAGQNGGAPSPPVAEADLPPRYIEACRIAGQGQYAKARSVYARTLRRAPKRDQRLRGLIQNDLAVLDAIEGKFEEAREGWRRAVEADGESLTARLNRDLLEAEISLADGQEELGELKLVPAPGSCSAEGGPVPSCQLANGRTQGLRSPPPQPSPVEGEGDLGGAGTGNPLRSARVSNPAVRLTGGLHAPDPRSPDDPIRVAVLSFLFNWPSTGGGNMHTAGLVDFLGRAGYEVRHFFARYPAWGIGRVAHERLTEGPGRQTGRADVGQAFQPDVSPPRRICDLERLTYNKPAATVSLRQALEFDEASWNVGEIQARYRRAVDVFRPDYVAITDAWNMKPLLAEALRGYPVFLLFQAQECLCPLNNLRLLGVGPNQVEQCPRNQLATPQDCRGCLAQRGHHSGALHQVERALAGVGTAEYDQKLRRSLLEAEAVLALNPLTAAMLEPYARRVCVVPWGIDAGRFPWVGDGGTDGRPAVREEGGVVRPAPNEGGPAVLPEGGVVKPAPNEGPDGDEPSSAVELTLNPESTLSRSERQHLLFMAAVVGETIKGFHIAHEACRLLRQTREDFELVVTFDPARQIDEFTRSVGWQSQTDLPRQYRAADICLVPTIAQDGLSITSVEAMASGRPVIASQIGGVPYTVTDGVTGLLCEPGDPADLAAKIARLLDDPELRHQMGVAGRRRFEADFTWETVIERYWRPLLGRRATAAKP